MFYSMEVTIFWIKKKYMFLKSIQVLFYSLIHMTDEIIK